MNVAAIDQGRRPEGDSCSPRGAELKAEDRDDLVGAPPFVEDIQVPIQRHEGDDLPVSAFVGMADGAYPTGTPLMRNGG